MSNFRTRRAAIDVMMRMLPYLPLFIALSTSSPFWQRRATGLKGYRLAAYDELPRTGLPELFRTIAEYDAYVDAMVRSDAMQDASHLWWAIRPSLKYPTLELRAPDCCTRLDDTIAIAALYRSLARFLYGASRAQCRARRGRPGDCGREQMAGPALRRAGHVRHAVGRRRASPRCSTGFSTSWRRMRRRSAAPSRWEIAGPSFWRELRPTLSCAFLLKINTKVPKLPCKR